MANSDDDCQYSWTETKSSVYVQNHEGSTSSLFYDAEEEPQSLQIDTCALTGSINSLQMNQDEISK